MKEMEKKKRPKNIYMQGIAGKRAEEWRGGCGGSGKI
jgi:hypothetical protein